MQRKRAKDREGMQFTEQIRDSLDSRNTVGRSHWELFHALVQSSVGRAHHVAQYCERVRIDQSPEASEKFNQTENQPGSF